MELTVIGNVKATTVVAITMAARGVRKTNQQCVQRKHVLMYPISVAHQIAQVAKKISVVLRYVKLVWNTVCYTNMASFWVRVKKAHDIEHRRRCLVCKRSNRTTLIIFRCP